MGSALGPTLANIFLSHLEIEWIDSCPSDFKPLKYYRYVDDTFVIFRDSSHSDQFLQYINFKHKNIIFTMETESSNQISFLNLNITKENGFFFH